MDLIGTVLAEHLEVLRQQRSSRQITMTNFYQAEAVFSPFRANTVALDEYAFCAHNTFAKAAAHEFITTVKSDNGAMVLWFGCKMPPWVPVFQHLLPSRWYYFEKLQNPWEIEPSWKIGGLGTGLRLYSSGLHTIHSLLPHIKHNVTSCLELLPPGFLYNDFFLNHEPK